MGVGRVFQNFGIFRDMTLVENIVVAYENGRSNDRAFGLGVKPVVRIAREALTVLDSVGLRSLSDARAEKLSGGQMRLLEMLAP